MSSATGSKWQDYFTRRVSPYRHSVLRSVVAQRTWTKPRAGSLMNVPEALVVLNTAQKASSAFCHGCPSSFRSSQPQRSEVRR